MKTFNVEVGRLTKSTMGHDSGNIYMIIGCDEKFAYLCDGNYKKIDSPKKKSIKHLTLLNEKHDDIAQKLNEKKIVHNEEIYSRIKTYKENLKRKEEVNG